ncbi:zinc ribbon domain-containing protein [Paenibacillus thermotolerans]|uniref:zinc ribbon domain-containing protein n=1 Tax=Paenibacillus thermotolerans TaxID=3027807 RepID=UPI0023685A31|nr:MULTISPECIES: zinc ribbon domain-containing protein [unclassified Paenibacillus]
MENRKQDNRHQSTRSILRVLGILFIAAGIMSIGTAMVDFFTFDKFGGPFSPGPTKFHYFFIGIPLLFVGFVMTSYGFMGAVAKYQSKELTPVAKETFNEFAAGVKPGVREISKGFAEGQGTSAPDLPGIVCDDCGTENERNSKYCKGCGSTLPVQKQCAACNHLNDADASYCTECGQRL